jgi:hypothetical protein
MVSSISLPVEKPIQVRKSFSIKYKWHAINAINDLILSGYKLHAATRELNIPHWYYKRWRKTVDCIRFILTTGRNSCIGEIVTFIV